jgi:hypothetical protein
MATMPAMRGWVLSPVWDWVQSIVPLVIQAPLHTAGFQKQQSPSQGWLGGSLCCRNSRKGQLINPLLSPSLSSDHVSCTQSFSLILLFHPILFQLQIILCRWSVDRTYDWLCSPAKWNRAVWLIFALTEQTKCLNVLTSVKTRLAYVYI